MVMMMMIMIIRVVSYCPNNIPEDPKKYPNTTITMVFGQAVLMHIRYPLITPGWRVANAN